MDWKQKIEKIMRERNISQKELSKLSGISESSISRYLHDNQRPRIDIVLNLAKALNVSSDYFLNEDVQETSFDEIATMIARKGKKLSPDEKNELIKIILGD